MECKAFDIIADRVVYKNFFGIFDNTLYQALHRMSSSAVTRDCNEFVAELLQDLKSLLSANIFHQRLTEVVGIGVTH